MKSPTERWEAEADRLRRIDELTFDDDVVRFVAHHGLGPVGRRRGQGRGEGRITYILCPFHQEKTASFALYAASATRSGRVRAFCYGCHWSGDLLDVAAALRGLTAEELLEGPCAAR